MSSGLLFGWESSSSGYRTTPLQEGCSCFPVSPSRGAKMEDKHNLPSTSSTTGAAMGKNVIMLGPQAHQGKGQTGAMGFFQIQTPVLRTSAPGSPQIGLSTRTLDIQNKNFMVMPPGPTAACASASAATASSAGVPVLRFVTPAPEFGHVDQREADEATDNQDLQPELNEHLMVDKHAAVAGVLGFRDECQPQVDIQQAEGENPQVFVTSSTGEHHPQHSHQHTYQSGLQRGLCGAGLGIQHLLSRTSSSSPKAMPTTAENNIFNKNNVNGNGVGRVGLHQHSVAPPLNVSLGLLPTKSHISSVFTPAPRGNHRDRTAIIGGGGSITAGSPMRQGGRETAMNAPTSSRPAVDLSSSRGRNRAAPLPTSSSMLEMQEQKTKRIDTDATAPASTSMSRSSGCTALPQAAQEQPLSARPTVETENPSNVSCLTDHDCILTCNVASKVDITSTCGDNCSTTNQVEGQQQEAQTTIDALTRQISFLQSRLHMLELHKEGTNERETRGRTRQQQPLVVADHTRSAASSTAIYFLPTTTCAAPSSKASGRAQRAAVRTSTMNVDHNNKNRSNSTRRTRSLPRFRRQNQNAANNDAVIRRPSNSQSPRAASPTAETLRSGRAPSPTTRRMGLNDSCTGDELETSVGPAHQGINLPTLLQDAVPAQHKKMHNRAVMFNMERQAQDHHDPSSSTNNTGPGFQMTYAIRKVPQLPEKFSQSRRKINPDLEIREFLELHPGLPVRIERTEGNFDKKNTHPTSHPKGGLPLRAVYTLRSTKVSGMQAGCRARTITVTRNRHDENVVRIGCGYEQLTEYLENVFFRKMVVGMSSSTSYEEKVQVGGLGVEGGAGGLMYY
ncbi:unnamed protein product [Amoebophrya sp. A25]|nr:unnamed protein product [Amoebophrya sp. A25]|eukprot:GSA25T00021964001.1